MASLDGDDRFARLVVWSQSLGGRLHEAAEIYRDDVTQISLRVRSKNGEEKQLESGEEAIFCPLSTTLSYLNALEGGRPLGSSAAEEAGLSPGRLTFPNSFLEQAPPHVIGRFFLMQQYLMGQQSHWHAYIASLPQPEHVSSWNLPALWPRNGEDAESGPALLEGTNAGIAAAEMQANVAQEYRQARRLLKSVAYPALAEFTRLLYHWAFCIFTSRSFRPSLVLSAEAQTELGTDGEASGGRSVPRLSSGCKTDDFSILLPVLDLANHDPTARATWEATSAHLADGSASGHEAASVTGVSFRVQQRYAPGQQVFNNYGMKTNSELLLGYGFVLPPTATLHNDYVHLRKRGASAAVAGTEAGTGQPRDFLLSLRPMDDSSSVVGASRQWPRRTTVAGGLPSAFSRFEDALLWDLCSQMWTEADRQQTLGLEPGMEVSMDAIPLEQRTAVLDRVFAAASPEQLSPFSELEDRARQTLFAKVAMDYERLAEGEQYVAEEEDVDASERANWQLAQAYRQQYGAVLINALKTLDPEVELVEAP
ncbi:set domain containing protein [Grosmannia clavigera kw1407]|uniref:Set domain containing protein n=1 Tax=Grosmannia clavigera (strain kw1407 / UAMH 11150) TaxID=655863 RepID=F0XV38_GROCL|nr:set domain containing protein [Grosmannia clavigera kw1407]EFW99029.1 set domain containing protein [Grosmannia clavigera kw1407]